MKAPLFLAAGAGANQGALILVALALPLAGISFAVISRARRKGRSIIGTVICTASLLLSGFVLYVWGLPGLRDYWGAYIPLVPLALSVVGLSLSARKKKPNSEEPTLTADTSAAEQPLVPAGGVAKTRD